MKMELRLCGKVVVIEAAGDVSVSVRDEVAAAPVSPSVDDEPPVYLLPSSAPAPASPSVVDDAIFRRLADLRKELAAEGGVPPYVIFHDKTLREMVEKMPVDMAAMGRVAGVGASKLEKYGPRFLAALNGVA